MACWVSAGGGRIAYGKQDDWSGTRRGGKVDRKTPGGLLSVEYVKEGAQ